MIAYKGDKAPVITQGGFVICEFNGETAEVTKSVGEVLKTLGYRVEENPKPDSEKAAPETNAENTEDKNDTDGNVETVSSDSNGAGSADTSRNGKKRN